MTATDGENQFIVPPKNLQSAQSSLFLSEYYPLKCMYCEKDLLQKDNLGNLVFIYQYAKDNSYRDVKTIYWSCKGKCDRKLESMHTPQTIRKYRT